MPVKIKYQLANTAGYNFNLAEIGRNVYHPADFYSKDIFPDALVTRPNYPFNPEVIESHCLVSVNGFIHPVVLDNSKLYIKNANRIRPMGNTPNNYIGILDFTGLPEPLERISITSDMVSAELDQPLFEKVIITTPKPTESVILIIAGYMVFEDPETFYRVSDTSFALRLDKLSFVEKLYELNRYTDIFSALGIDVSNANPSMIDYQQATSNETIMKFLTLFNSFMVNVPCANITATKVYLEHSKIPGTFRTEIDPTLPIVTGYGKLSEYAKRKTSQEKYSVYTVDSVKSNHLFTTVNQKGLSVVNDHRVMGNRLTLSQAYFLDIECTVY